MVPLMKKPAVNVLLNSGLAFVAPPGLEPEFKV